MAGCIRMLKWCKPNLPPDIGNMLPSGTRSSSIRRIIVLFAVCIAITVAELLDDDVSRRNDGNTGDSSKKVLLYTRFYAHSHASIFMRMARLLQQKGCNIHLLISSDVTGSIPRADIQAGFILHTYSSRNGSIREKYRTMMDKINSDTTSLEVITNHVDLDKMQCENLLRSGLLSTLKRQNFNVLIVDITDFCGRIVSDFLHVPTIVYTHLPIEVMIFDVTMFPMPLGMISIPISTRVNIDDMSFYDRLWNTVVYLAVMNTWQRLAFGAFQSLRIRYDMNATLAVENSLLRTVVMTPSDSALDPPRPLMPNVICIGDIHKIPARPVASGILSDFITSSGTRGFIIVCFGTYLPSLVNSQMVELMARVFARLPVHVVWRHTGSPPHALGNNTLLVEWIPQNDLLAAGARAFVSHCGITSIFEAARHGVPVVAMPVFADQFVNALKLKRIGMALIVNWNSGTDDSLETRLYEALELILKQPQYRQQAIHTASLLADQLVSPEDKFLYYVDHIARYGVDHLISTSLSSKNTVQLYNIDVFVLLIFLVTVVCAFVVFLLYCISNNIMKQLYKKRQYKIKQG